MRVLIVNTFERMGGAAIAANRLMSSLKNHGIKTKMLVRDKQTDQISVVDLNHHWLSTWNFVWERIVIWGANHFKRNNLFDVDIANTGIDITSLPEFIQADIIHLHWINQGMLSIRNLRKIFLSGKPVVWTMHDMWPCTGICHYARTCMNYRQECQNCPYLYKNSRNKDLSYRVFKRKRKLYTQHNIVFVACSNWLKTQAQKSALLRNKEIVAIPNPINTNLYKPQNKQQARLSCNLPLSKRLILFGSVKITDQRKGATYLIEACKLLALQYPDWVESTAIVVFGKQSQQLMGKVPFEVCSFPYIHDERELISVYNAVDVFATPSLEENLPNMIMEAMACGIPCVGFNIGGIPEMIDHLHNGYVAHYKPSEDFANGIHWVLSEPSYEELALQARRKVLTNYSESTVAKKYTAIYNQVTGRHV